jgi:hypothetical protein
MRSLLTVRLHRAQNDYGLTVASAPTLLLIQHILMPSLKEIFPIVGTGEIFAIRLRSTNLKSAQLPSGAVCTTAGPGSFSGSLIVEDI